MYYEGKNRQWIDNGKYKVLENAFLEKYFQVLFISYLRRPKLYWLSMKYFYTVLLTVLLPITLFAQKNYQEGYVLKTQGDTLKGYIDSHDWLLNPSLIHFKYRKEDKNYLEFNGSTLKEVSITGIAKYRAYVGHISTNVTELSNLPRGLDTSSVQDTVFLELITTGKYLTLYSHVDIIKTRYFISEKNGNPVELKYYRYQTDGQITEREIFKGQLAILTGKYSPESTPKLGDIKYNLNHLENIVNSVNGNQKVKRSNNTHVGFFIGVGIDKAKNKTVDYNGNYSPEQSSENIPKINLGFDLDFNKTQRTFIFRTELSFYSSRPDISFTSVENTGNYHIQTVTKRYSIAVAPQILMNIVNEKYFRFYIDAGFGLEYSFLKDGSYTFNNKTYNSNNYAPQESIFYTPFQAGIVIWNKVELYANYINFYNAKISNNNGIVNNSYSYSVKESLGAGIKYLFK